MNEPLQENKVVVEEHRTANVLAAILSIVPGLGHFYKGWRIMGIGLLLATPLMIYVSVLMILGTLGMSLLLVPLYWTAVMAGAYWIDDHKARHWIG